MCSTKQQRIYWDMYLIEIGGKILKLWANVWFNMLRERVRELANDWRMAIIVAPQPHCHFYLIHDTSCMYYACYCYYYYYRFHYPLAPFNRERKKKRKTRWTSFALAVDFIQFFPVEFLLLPLIPSYYLCVIFCCTILPQLKLIAYRQSDHNGQW